MPTRLHAGVAPAPLPLTRTELWELCNYGVLVFPTPDDGPGFKTDADARRAWKKHGEEIMQLWTRGIPIPARAGLPMPRGRPGTRPAGWWEFEAREPRRQTGTPEPFHGFDPDAWREHFGLPRGVSLHDPAYESERAYLDRLGLLTEVELELLKEVSRA